MALNSETSVPGGFQGNVSAARRKRSNSTRTFVAIKKNQRLSRPTVTD